MTEWQPIETAPEDKAEGWLFVPPRIPTGLRTYPLAQYDAARGVWLNWQDRQVVGATHYILLPPDPK